MTALKETYPYYLANEAKTPNTDLEVTDKYTGKVATRVAHGGCGRHRCRHRRGGGSGRADGADGRL